MVAVVVAVTLVVVTLKPRLLVPAATVTLAGTVQCASPMRELRVASRM
jgi:hypothetical protein